MMNADEMSELGLKTRDIIDISSHFAGEIRTAKKWQVIPYDIPKGNIATYFPEANELVPLNSTADISNTPTSKWIVCSLIRSSSEEE